MASVHKHIRSGTASKRPTTAIAEGQIALATNITSPGLFFKDSTGATIVKIGPVHVGTTAPNATPAGSAGNSIGEVWLDTSLTPVGVKIYNGTAFVNATPIGSTTVQGLLELATDAETQTGSDVARAVTPASLQSKLSDSTSTTSPTTIASSTAVKAAFDLAGLALPKTGGTVTGNLEIGTAGSLSFEGATADNFETTIAVVDPTADRTITLPNTTGTVVTTGDTGSVTSTMLLNGTILNEDINASAAIVDTKLATIATAGKVSNSATTATNANTASTIVARDASGSFTAGTITANLTGTASNVTTNANLSGHVTSVGNAAVLGSFTSANLATALTDETGTGANVFATSPTLVTPILGTPSSGTLTNCTFPTLNQNTTGNAATVTTNANLTGDVTSTGNATAIAAGVIVNADVNASAAIAGTKIAPNFGAQTITTTGVISPALGTAALPSVAFTGDLNTGIFSPGADQLAISTNGTQKLIVLSDGKVGIGTSGPGQNITVQSSASGTAPTFKLQNPIDSNSSEGAANNLSAGQLLFGATGAFPLTAKIESVYNANASFGRAAKLIISGANGAGTLTERVAIDEAGRLGIGTTSPGSALHVVGTSSLFGNGGAAADWGNTSTLGRLTYLSGNPIIHSVGGSTPLLFGTNLATERARIDSSGRLLVGTSTSNSGGGAIECSSVNATSHALIVNQIEPTPGTTYKLISGHRGVFGSSALETFIVYNSGNVQNANNSYAGISDVKLKENIVDARSQWEDIKDLQVRNYNFKEETGHQTHIQIGLVAQEVELVSPGLVSESPDRDADDNDLGTVTKSVNYSVLYMKAVKALQEAMERIETLEQRLTAAGID